MNLEIDTESKTVKRGECVIFRVLVGSGYEGDVAAIIEDVEDKLSDYFGCIYLGIERHNESEK